jgi:hypothetical protein
MLTVSSRTRTDTGHPPRTGMPGSLAATLVIDHGTGAYLLAGQIAAASIPVVVGPLFTSHSRVELRNRTLANPGRLAAAG